MNLPFVLDVAIGLVFIYLILSLLASEIQELITTLLQWRAAHLKKSIEILLVGGEGTPQDKAVEAIVTDLYQNPLIKNINQEAKEGIALFFRQITWKIGDLYRNLRGQKNAVFGDDTRSAPSYIPAETFATTLLNRLGVTQLSSQLGAFNLNKVKEDEIKHEIRNLLSQIRTLVSDETNQKLAQEFDGLQPRLDRIVTSFKTDRITLTASFDQLKSEIEEYITNSDSYFTDEEAAAKKTFDRTMNGILQDLFSTNNLEHLTRRLTPTITEVMQLINPESPMHQEIMKAIKDTDGPTSSAYQDIGKDIEKVINSLPKAVRESLTALALRAQIKATSVEQEMSQYKQEIETWFDRSMERASGVYKRNAKGVAVMIGLALAGSANADTLHIVNRLSTDTALRNTITQNAGQFIKAQANQTTDLKTLRQQTDEALKGVSLPIGWGDDNLDQQIGWRSTGGTFPWLKLPKMFLGWALSGMAIAMGAPFWFDLLSKVVNVRNTGSKPKAAPEQSPPAYYEPNDQG